MYTYFSLVKSACLLGVVLTNIHKELCFYLRHRVMAMLPKLWY